MTVTIQKRPARAAKAPREDPREDSRKEPAQQDRKAPPAPGASRHDVVFMDTVLEVGQGVVVPRVETELLVTEALACMEAHPHMRTVVDLCCGCGAIAVALAKRKPGIEVRACDLLEPAVAIARRNVRRHGLESRITVSQGDLFSAFQAEGLERRVDLVVANPPYISTGRLEGEKAHLLESEPREAFDGGPYGLTIHQRLISEAPAFLLPGGWLLLEFGHGQERQISALIGRRGGYGTPSFAYDEMGAARAVAVRWHGWS